MDRFRNQRPMGTSNMREEGRGWAQLSPESMQGDCIQVNFHLLWISFLSCVLAQHSINLNSRHWLEACIRVSYLVQIICKNIWDFRAKEHRLQQ